MLGFFSEAQTHVVHTCWEAGLNEDTLLICYDGCSGRHSVWSIQSAKPQVSLSVIAVLIMSHFSSDLRISRLT